MTTETQPSIDGLRGELAEVRRSLTDLERAALELPGKAKILARQGLLDEAARARVQVDVLPELIQEARTRVQQLQDQIEEAEIAELQDQASKLRPAVEETERAMNEAIAAHQAAWGAWQGALSVANARRDNLARARFARQGLRPDGGTPGVIYLGNPDSRIPQ